MKTLYVITMASLKCLTNTVFELNPGQAIDPRSASFAQMWGQSQEI